MSPAINTDRFDTSLGTYRDLSVGRASAHVRRALSRTFFHGHSAIERRVGLENLGAEFQEILVECGETDWDGCGAVKIEEQTLLDAWRALIQLPTHIPLPEICPEPSGALGLEWKLRPFHSVIIAFDGSEFVEFARLRGVGTRLSGVYPFYGVLHYELLRELDELYR